MAVIVGGGKVAARKAAGLLSAGAKQVRCVAPRFCDEFPASVERIAESYAERHLDGAAIAFAATDDPQVNTEVVRDCRRRQIWVNRADSDEDDPGDFSTPARLDAGSIIVTVSAGSPTLSATIRDALEPTIDSRFIAMADAMRTLRPMVKSSTLKPSQRAEVFRALADSQALAILESGGLNSLRQWLASRYPELAHE